MLFIKQKLKFSQTNKQYLKNMFTIFVVLFNFLVSQSLLYELLNITYSTRKSEAVIINEGEFNCNIF